jgi:hypothetical protein
MRFLAGFLALVLVAVGMSCFLLPFIPHLIQGTIFTSMQRLLFIGVGILSLTVGVALWFWVNKPRN